MKNIWLVLVAILMLGGAAFWWNAQQQKQLELLRQQTDSMRIEAAKIASNAEQLNAQSLALQQQVAGDRELAMKERERYMNAAHLAQGLAVASKVKIAITEYYQSQGAWPESNSQVELPDADSFNSVALKSMAVREQGVIVLTYNGASGMDGGEIQLIPKFNEARQEVDWSCVSSTFAQISSIIPQCSYKAPEHNGS